jgi:NADH-quinone oxidoreductase subunit I
MMVTLRHLFREPFTIKYPEEIRPVPVNARTNLLWFEERCTGCSTCAQACPDGCILVQTSPREDGSMYCGLCVEACPYEAIQAGGPLNDAEYNFEHLYRDKHRLTEMAQEHLHGHDWTYPNGKKAPQADEKPLHIGLPVERDRTR